MTEPTRSRAVLSTEDFKLLKEAVRFYLQNNEDSPDSAKYSNLYHRLGSAAGR
jgi:CCR4-NOT transcriptional regulation complex NOT5 subunit